MDNKYFSVEEMLPAAGQGILAVQGRSGTVWDCLKEYYDPESAAAAVCDVFQVHPQKAEKKAPQKSRGADGRRRSTKDTQENF